MSTATRLYFACWYRLYRADRYLIWYDGVYLEETGRTPTFGSIAELGAFAAGAGIPMQPREPVRHDLDAVDRWLTEPRPEGIDCDEFLAAWNLFGDIDHTVGVDFVGDADSTLRVYDKLFSGKTTCPL
jgi:hypothetical protein